MSKHHFTPRSGRVVRAGAGTSQGAATDRASAGSRRMRYVVVAAVAVAIAPAGCGGSTGPDSERTTSRALPLATAATTVSAMGARRAPASSPELRGRHLREYRQMIVALYRVPGRAAAGARSADPLDELWRNLAQMYGPVLKPRPYPRAQSKAAGEEQRRPPGTTSPDMSAS